MHTTAIDRDNVRTTVPPEPQTWTMLQREIQAALQRPDLVTPDQLRNWVAFVDRHGDFWMRAHLARLLAETHAGDPVWGRIVMDWLYESARQRSCWTEDLIFWAVRGWRDWVFRLPKVAAGAILHPRGIAQGLAWVIQERLISPESVPDQLLHQMIQSADRRSWLDQIAVARLLARTRAGENAWGLPIVDWIQHADIDEFHHTAMLVALLIRHWPKLASSRLLHRILEQDRTRMRRVLSYAILQQWLHPEDIPSDWLDVLRMHAHPDLGTHVSLQHREETGTCVPNSCK